MSCARDAGGSESNFSFQKDRRLLRAVDFRRVSKSGTRRVSRFFVVIREDRASDAEGAGPRLGITVSRKVGNAVVRNRIKRRIREWFRQSDGQILGSSDYVVIARKGASELDSRELASDLEGLFEGTRA